MVTDYGVREYQHGDLWLLRGRLIKSAESSYLYGERATDGVAFTFVKNGVVEACAGMLCVPDGVELWGAPSQTLVDNHLLEYCRLVKRLITVAGGYDPAVVVHIEATDRLTQRWAKWLGFTDTGIRKEGGLMMLVLGDGGVNQWV